VKNITVTLPEEDAHWVRVRAAENGRSVSRWLADLLQAMKRQEDGYAVAMERALAVEPALLNESGKPYPSRDSLHDRDGLR
jgi:plasmid stability protein